MRHNSGAHLICIPTIRRAFSALSIALSLVFAIAAFGVQQGTSWTYQGQLRRSGAAYNGTCNFEFNLWNAVSGGAQQSGTLQANGVPVVNGLFTVVLDFGAAFTGEALWLATSVQCSGDGGFTQLDPRQAITAAPYALSLRPGASVTGGFQVLEGGLVSTSTIGTAVYGSGLTGVYATTTLSNGNGLHAEASGPNSVGIFARNTSSGLAGRFIGSVDIAGSLVATNNAATSPGAIEGNGFVGVRGATTVSSGVGVYGSALSTNSAGVFGSNRDSAAIWGQSTGGGAAVYGQNTGGGLAGRFTGPVVVEGALIVQGPLTKSSGTFRIDHPLDPAHKYLSHSFVESPDMLNIYNGNVTTDATGTATVTLPAYFAALNRDYRYQLTVVGQFAQAIVSREIIADNTFAIRTDKPGVKVSWQVTGIRQDAYAKENPIVVEQAKSAEEDGKYLYPAGFGADEEKGIGYSERPTRADAPDRLGAGQKDPASK